MKQQMQRFVKTNEFFLFVVIAVICIVFAVINPAIFSVNNIFSLLKSMTETGILAMGVLLVMISGGIDLSFMAIAVFSMHCVSLLFGNLYPDAPMVLLIVVGVAIGIVLGLFNSFFIARLKLPPFITTLGTSSIIHGILLAFIGSQQYNKIPTAMIEFSRKTVITVHTAAGDASLHVGVIAFVVIAVITSFILNKTMLGRSIYAVGGSPSSAERIGLKNIAILMFVYAFAGAVAGSVGIMHGSFQRMSNPLDLVGGELNVIAAVTLGGPKVGGGYGNVSGTILGVFLITIINNSLVMLRIPTFYQKAVTGLIIIVGTVAQMYRYKKSLKDERR